MAAGLNRPGSILADELDSGAYPDLRKRIKRAELLEAQPRYYAGKFGITAGLLACGVAILAVVHVPWLQLLDAAFLAFVCTQIAFLGHDVSHHAVFRNRRLETAAGLILANLVLGLSRAWWLKNHNAHHSNPNDFDHDPDVHIPILALSEDQALRTRGIARFIVRYQDRFFFPMLCLEMVSMHRQSARVLAGNKVPYQRTEVGLLMVHALAYCWLIFLSLGLLRGILFIAIHKALTGLYMASVFAPNHKGMPYLDGRQQMDFLHRQILTSRNVRGNALIDFWYGGLNYQIEHHLFPAMPRNRLHAAQPIVKTFCAEQHIPYHEVGMIRSYREMLAYFRQVSLVLRREGE